jgi:hypothetical protein
VEWIKRLPKITVAPDGADRVTRRNYRNVQIDAVGIGFASAAAPFLPVFLARLGASTFAVGLLTAMPAVTGLMLALALGRFLHSQRKIVPWFSTSRLLVISAYACTGLAPFLVPRSLLVASVLAIWALATIPQTVLNIAFSVVMNAVAGAGGRYDLMSRRWTILGFTTAVSVLLAGEVLDRIGFPINYQIVFLVLSLGGLVSFYFSSHIELPETTPAPLAAAADWRGRFSGYAALFRSNPAFTSFVFKRFVFLTGTYLALPIFPLYFVRTVQASDAWIGAISMIQTGVLLFGYPFWARQSKLHDSRVVLFLTTLGVGIYPILAALTHQVGWIALLAGGAGIFQAGVDLVFFDELMKTIPDEYSAMFVSLSQALTYLPAVVAPLLGTLLAGWIGLGGALVAAGILRLLGTLLFALPASVRETELSPAEPS